MRAIRAKVTTFSPSQKATKGGKLSSLSFCHYSCKSHGVSLWYSLHRDSNLFDLLAAMVLYFLIVLGVSLSGVLSLKSHYVN